MTTHEVRTDRARSELLTALRTWLPAQRWFAGTDELSGEVRLTSASTLLDRPQDGLWVDHLVVSTDDGDSTPRHHQLWVGFCTELPDRLAHSRIADLDHDSDQPLVAFDALADSTVTSTLLAAIAGAEQLPGITAESPDPSAIDQTQSGLALSGEQSNTSIVFGNTSILKVFRRLEAGINPDSEVLQALQERNNPSVASLLGTLTGTLDDTPTTLAVLTGFFAGSADGWLMATASVRDLIGEGDLHADEVGGDFAADSYRLGEAVAGIHTDLAAVFSARTAERDEVTQILRSMAEDARVACALTPALAEFADAIQNAFEQAAAAAEPLTLQRIHGDLHLGQTLRTLTGWAVIDFEGEPSKSVEYRRSALPLLRDIAGMLRSYDYAAHHLLPSSTHAQHSYRATEWALRNRAAFLDGYVAGGGSDPRRAATLLRAFELDKAVYEVRYEADHRPSWVGIPLAAVRQLVSSGEPQ